MKPLTFAILLTTLASCSAFAEPPDGRASEPISTTEKPFAVAFNGDGCPMCSAWASAPRNLSQGPEFMGITLFVVKFDSENVLERSLGITEHRTIAVFKDGKQGVRSTGVAQYETLSELLQRVIW